MDNASNCDTLAQILGILMMERYGVPFHSDNACIRCLAHVVNLTVQTILCTLDEADDPLIFDWYEANKNAPVHYDPDQDEDQLEIEAETYDMSMIEIDNDECEDLLLEDVSLLSPVKKVRNYTSFRENIKYSPGARYAATHHYKQDSRDTPTPFGLQEMLTKAL